MQSAFSYANFARSADVFQSLGSEGKTHFLREWRVARSAKKTKVRKGTQTKIVLK